MKNSLSDALLKTYNTTQNNAFYLVEGHLVNWSTYRKHWKQKVKIQNREILQYGLYICYKEGIIRTNKFNLKQHLKDANPRHTRYQRQVFDGFELVGKTIFGHLISEL